MIDVYSHLFEHPVVPLFNFCTYLNQGLFAVRTSKDRESILYWYRKVIMDLIRIMFRCSDRSHTLIVLPIMYPRSSFSGCIMRL